MEGRKKGANGKENNLKKIEGLWRGGCLETFPVDDGGAGLVVFLLGDPHLLEGGEGGEDGSSDPYGVFALWGSDDLDLHGGWGEGGDFLLHPVGDSRVHGGASREHGVGVQVLTDVHVALHDGVVSGFVDTAGFHSQEGRLEEGFGAPEPLVSDGDDLTVGKLVGLFEGRGGRGGGHFLLEVQSDVAELLLDVTDDLPFGGGREGVASLGEDLHKVVGQVTASQVETEDGVGESVSLVDRDGVGDTISGVEDDTSGTTGGVQRQDSLDGHVHGGCVEGFEHDLGHLLPVGLRVEGGFSQEDGVFLGGDSQLVVEGVVPDFLHIVPVGDDTVFDGVLQGEDTPFALGLVSDVGVFLAHTDHDTLMPGSAHNGGEDGPGGIVSGESGFAHTGSIVNNERSNFFVAHFGFGLLIKSLEKTRGRAERSVLPRVQERN
uniref:Uncharacterized protein n=1 Tax=Lygus hesperus TaxID=30085 RepID=A0A146M3T5_LYGHE